MYMDLTPRCFYTVCKYGLTAYKKNFGFVSSNIPTMANAMSSSGRSEDRPLIKCFKPIFYWMRLLGICLIGEQHPFAIFYGLLMFSFTLASNVASMALMILDDTEQEKKETYTFKQILVIDNLNFTASAVGVHLMLLCQTRRSWKKLWSILLELEMQLNRKIIYRSYLIALLFIPVSRFLWLIY